MMTVLSPLFYLMNMVVAELLFDHISIAVFVTLKHILPYLVNIAVPVLVLVTQDDIRSEAQVIDTPLIIDTHYIHPLHKTHTIHTPLIEDTHYTHTTYRTHTLYTHHPNMTSSKIFPCRQCLPDQLWEVTWRR